MDTVHFSFTPPCNEGLLTASVHLEHFNTEQQLTNLAYRVFYGTENFSGKERTTEQAKQTLNWGEDFLTVFLVEDSLTH